MPTSSPISYAGGSGTRIYAGRFAIALSGGVALADAAASGALGVNASLLSGGVTLSDAVAAGNVGAAQSWGAGQAAICVLGNSLVAGLHGTPPASYLANMSPVVDNATPVTAVAVSGATSVDLLSYVPSVTAAYVNGRTNILIIWEVTNSVTGTSGDAAVSPQQAVNDLFNLAAACTAAKPWHVVYVTAIPRYQYFFATGAPADDTKSAALNAALDSANSLLAAQWSTGNGISGAAGKMLIDMRAGTHFALPNYNSTSFTAVLDNSGNPVYFPEADGGGTDYVHEYNFGYQYDAQIWAAALNNLPA